jgi:hypothetical protein
MRRDFDDLHAVRSEHVEIHNGLINWSRYVTPNGRSQGRCPMFSQYRSSEVWGTTVSIPVDRLAGAKMEGQVFQLPEKHREAIRWCYVYARGSDKYRPLPWQAAAKWLGVRKSGLVDLIHDARSMLRNRTR